MNSWKVWAGVAVTLLTLAAVFSYIQSPPPAKINSKGETGERKIVDLNHAANVQVQKGNYPEAIEIYLRALKGKPNSPTILLNLTRVSSMMGNYDQALGYIRRAKKFRPNYLPLLLQEAVILRESFQLEEAVKLLKQVVEKKPDYLLAWLTLTHLFIRQRQWKEGEEGLAQCQKLGDSERIATLAIYLHYERGRWDLALAEADKLLVRKYQGLVWKGRIYLAKGESERGIDLLSKSIPTGSIPLSKEVPLQILLGDLWRAQGDFAKAKEIFHEVEKKLEFAKGALGARYLPNVREKIGFLFLAQGDLSGSETYWKKMKENSSSHLAKSSQLWLGVTYALQGQNKKARGEWQGLRQKWSLKKMSELSAFTRLLIALEGKVPPGKNYLSYLGRRFKNDYYYILGIHFLSQGKPMAARKAWENAIQATNGKEAPYHLIQAALKKHN